MLHKTKLLPKLVMRIESFNKFVIFLSNKTKSDLSNYLHIGTVRDFRILTEPLRDCLDQTLQHANDIEVNESLLDNSDNDDDDDTESRSSVDDQPSVSFASTSSNIIRDAPLPANDSEKSVHIAIGNMKKINEKAKRRSINKKAKRRSSNSDDSAGIQEESVKKKKRKLGKPANERWLE